MSASKLLTRLTAALSTAAAVSLGLAACGQTTDGESGSSGNAGGGTTTGGSGAGGSGTAGSGAGGSGTAGSGAGGSGTAGGGTAGSGTGGNDPGVCLRELPTTSPQGVSCRADAECQKGGVQPNGSRCYAPGRSACDGVGGNVPPCKTNADCEDGGQPAFGPVCQPRDYGDSYCVSKCTDDASCDPSFACDLATGMCTKRSCASAACPAQTYCTAAQICALQRCNATRPCGPGQSCSSTDFICSPTVCANDGDCPSTFRCGEGGTCQQRSCTCDSECGPSGTFCLEGACYTGAGHCEGGCGIGRPLVVGDGEALVARLVWGARDGGWSTPSA